MSLTVKPSLQGRFALVYSGDPALQPRPEDLPEGAQAADVAERVEAQKKWDHDLTVARERGEWGPLVKEGERPSTFYFQLPHGVARTALIEVAQTGEIAGTIIGWTQRFSLVFRCLLRSVTNFNDHEVKVARHKGLGIDMAQESIVDDMLEIGRALGVGDGILVEFGDILLRRLVAPTPGK